MTEAPGSPLIIGIDVGGTKTHLRAERGAGSNVSRRDMVVPSSEWRSRDWSTDASRLLDFAARLVDGNVIAAIGVGAHGCDDDEECGLFQKAFAAHTSLPVIVVNDAELMPLGLSMPGEIGVVAGTGSIAVCRSSSGEMVSAGGWGWVIGDEGSAAGLVREAVRAVTRYFDSGGDEEEILAQALLRSLQVAAVPRLGSTLAQLGSAAAIGAHAEAVFHAASEGSHLAENVIREGGRELARLVSHLEARGVGASHVVAGGSVIVSQPALWEAFASGVGELSQGRINPHLFKGAPVEGACFIARNIADAASHGSATSTAA